ncbi:hypothetical protein ACWC09_35970, partial [Streptomyces sp. NPDC001617]
MQPRTAGRGRGGGCPPAAAGVHHRAPQKDTAPPDRGRTPVSAAVGLANLDLFEREGLNQHVLDNEGAFLS